MTKYDSGLVRPAMATWFWLITDLSAGWESERLRVDGFCGASDGVGVDSDMDAVGLDAFTLNTP